MIITRLYTNDKDESAFAELEIPLERVDVETFPGQKAEQFLDLEAPHAMRINRTEAGHQYDWHNAPQRQLVITTGGAIEVELRDGTTKQFGPGSILLAEDLTGSGHSTRVISAEPWSCVYLPFKGEL